MAPTTVLVVLPAAPAQAVRCVVALAGLDADPAHDVVLVDRSHVGLEELLRAVEGDVQVVRTSPGGTLADAVAAGLAGVTTPTCVLLLDGGEPAPAAVARLLDALAAPGVACATAGDAHPAEARALALATPAPADVPAVRDDLLGAALVALGAGRGEVVAVPDARVAPPLPRGAQPPLPAFGTVELSVVVPTLDATSDRHRACVAALRAHTEVALEVISVDNGPMPQGFSAPVNAGLRAARGDYLVVCNDDVEVLPGWWAPLRAALDDGTPVAFPRTIDGAMREDFAAWCFALRRDALDLHGVAPGEFLDPGLVVWFQDSDLLERLRLAGTPPLLVEGSRIRHGLSATVGLDAATRPAWVSAQIARDAARFSALHGGAVAGAAH